MKNLVQDGAVLTLTAPYDVAAGGGALVGVVFGVAVTTAVSGAKVPLATGGVFPLAKTSAQAWTEGAKLYWDDTAKVATTTASGNTVIGYAVAVAANPSATGLVWVVPGKA